MKQNRVRTIVIIISVMLTTALLTAVTTFCSSIRNYMWDTYTYQSGTAHVIIEQATDETCQLIRPDDRIETLMTVSSVGYHKLEGTQGAVPYLCLAAADEPFLDEFSSHLLEGRMPQNEEEIVVPRNLIRQEGEAFGIGSQVELTLGIRKDAESGALNWSNNRCDYDPETGEVDQGQEIWQPLEPEQTVRATVVGVYKQDQFFDAEEAAFTVLTGGSAGATETAVHNLYIRLLNPTENLDGFTSFCRNVGKTGNEGRIHINYEILRMENVVAYGRMSGTSLILYESVQLAMLAGFLMSIIAVASMILICSAFQISVSERTRLLGMIVSVGASGRQLRRMVWLEALIVAAIGIPAGILLGIAGMGTTLNLLGYRFQELLGGYEAIRISVELWAILLAAVVSFAAVLVSAWIPSRRASRVTVMEAMRPEDGRRMRGYAGRNRIHWNPVSRRFLRKSAHGNRFGGRSFGPERAIAAKFYRRDRKKYRLTVLSLSLCVMMIITISGFNGYLTEVSSVYQEANYDLYTTVPYGKAEEFLKEIRELNSVEKVTAEWKKTETVCMEEEKVTEDFAKSVSSRLIRVYLDEETYEEILVQNRLESVRLAAEAENPAGIAVNRRDVIQHEPVGTDKVRRTVVSQKFLKEDVTELFIRGEWEVNPFYGYAYRDEVVQNPDGAVVVRRTYQTKTGEAVGTMDQEVTSVPIAAMIEEIPPGVDGSSNDLKVIYPLSSCSWIDEKSNVTLYFRTEEPTRMIRDVCALLEEHGILFDEHDFISPYANPAGVEELIWITQLFAWSFLALICLMAAINGFNMITANLLLRKRDFAMLTSFGMDPGQIRRLIAWECASCGIRAQLAGIAAGFGILGLFHWKVSSFFLSSGLVSPVVLVLTAAGMLLVVGGAMKYTEWNLKKMDGIEILRRDAV